MSDFTDYQPIESQKINTTAKHAPLEIKGKGTVFLNHYVQTPQGRLEKNYLPISSVLHPWTLNKTYVCGSSTQ